MSLTSHLANQYSPVRQFMHEWFPFTRPFLAPYRIALRGAETLRPVIDPAEHRAYPYGLIGHAIDYRIRYYFGVTPWKQLVASRGALCYARLPTREMRSPVLMASAFGRELDLCLARCQPVGRALDADAERELARYCLAMGLFEVAYRAPAQGLGPGSPLTARPLPVTPEQILARIEDAWTCDVVALSGLFRDRFCDRLTEPAILNPTFLGNHDVGGADADLILGDCLLEIKTTMDTSIKGDWLYQLLGYVLLDYDDTHGIRNLGIYFARQGLLLHWLLGDMLDVICGGNAIDLMTLRQEFRKLFPARPRIDSHTL